MQELPSGIPNSRAAALIPRSRSRPRSLGKRKPILAAMKALSRESCPSGMPLVNFMLSIRQSWLHRALVPLPKREICRGHE